MMIITNLASCPDAIEMFVGDPVLHSQEIENHLILFDQLKQ